MDVELKREQRRKKRQKIFSCCKKTIAFLFSHIGLCGLVVAYSIMGGFLFQALEGPAEVIYRNKIQGYKEMTIEQVWGLAVLVKGDKLQQNDFTESLRKIFLEFQENITLAVKEKGWDGKDGKGDLQWSFAGALLYAVTVITTIGYGHIAPKTSWGRLVTILYALVGIPLTFLYLSNIGNFLADCFRLIYKKVCCDILCCQKCERQRKRERYIRRRRKAMEARQNALALVETKMFTEDETGGNFTYGLPGGHSTDSPIKQDSVEDKLETEKDEVKAGETNVCFVGCDIDKELPQTVIDNMDKARETDILDSEFESDIGEREILDDTKDSKSVKVQRADSQISTQSDILSKLPGARETDILTDSFADGLDNPAMDINDEEQEKASKIQKKPPSGNNPKRRSLFGRFSKKSKKQKLKRQNEIEEKDLKLKRQEEIEEKDQEVKSDTEQETEAKSEDEPIELGGNNSEAQDKRKDTTGKTENIKLKSFKSRKEKGENSKNINGIKSDEDTDIAIKVKRKTKKKKVPTATLR